MTRINRWWTVISGASRFINDIVDAVTEGGSVIVKNSADIPFCDDLVGILSSRIGSEMHDRAIKMFDSSLIQEDTVEKYLCEHYCPDEFFIPSKGFTRTHFLVRSKVSWRTGLIKHSLFCLRKQTGISRKQNNAVS